MARCLGRDNLDQINEKWRAYVVSLSELALKLSTSYNIETIIEPLDVQISEAIMNFQENAPNITERVYKICGGPSPPESSSLHGLLHHTQSSSSASSRQAARFPPNRLARRSANPINMAVDYNRRGQQHLTPPQARATAPTTSTMLHDNRYKLAGFDSLAQELSHRTMDQNLLRAEQKSSILIDEIKKFAASSKVFWSLLPNSVCTSVLGSATNQTTTIGGVGPYKKQTNCYSEHFSVTDINSDIRYRTEILKQANYLDVVRSKIEDALSGVEVIWAPGQQQQQDLQVQANRGVGVEISAAGGRARPLSPMSFSPPTTAAAAAAAPSSDLSTVDDNEPGDPETFDAGSGEYENCTEEDPESCEHESHDTEETESSAGEDETNSSTSSYMDAPPTTPDSIEQNNNHINQEPSQTGDSDDPALVLITAPNQIAGFQKSSQISYKLVINFESQLLLSLITFVALLFVTNSTKRPMAVLTHRSRS